MLMLRSHGFAVGQIPGPLWGPDRSLSFAFYKLV
jgi:hypothetical protein